MGGTIDLFGRRFGRLVVLSDSGERASNRKVMWHCICDCGNKVNVQTSHLNSGGTKSCGCLQKEIASVTGTALGKSNITHGRYATENSAEYEKQLNDIRNKHTVTYKNKQYSISELAKEYKISYHVLLWKVNNNWSVEDAIETPIRNQRL